MAVKMIANKPYTEDLIFFTTLMGIKPGVTLPFGLVEEIAERTSASVTGICG